jgi:D-alanyl-D-alanine endopeptidase (penicillin-binding protein 7)
VIRKPFFWMGNFALLGLVSLGWPAGVAAQSTGSAQKPATAKPKATSKPPARPAYSASRARARRAALARARAAAAAREIADSVIPRYKVDASGDLVPDVRAAAAIVYNPETDEVLWEENSKTQRSIASITKVMTAAVVLESDPDLSERITVISSDVRRASTTYLRANDKLTREDLLHLLLIASDNAAARVLARVSPHGPAGFIDRMNEKAAELGLAATRYADPSGLLADNVSSAYDMARLIAYASSDDRIASIMQKSQHAIATPVRTISVRSTNHLPGNEGYQVMAAKTGFISKAGYCFATLLRLPQQRHQVAVVVLGARSNAGRFVEVQNLFNWLSAKASSLFATQTAATAVGSPN